MMNNPYYLIKNSFASIFSAFSLLSIMCLTTSFMWKTTYTSLSLTFRTLTLFYFYLLIYRNLLSKTFIKHYNFFWGKKSFIFFSLLCQKSYFFFFFLILSSLFI